MQRVRVRVARLRRYSADTSFDVAGDLGVDPIDFAHPLTPRPVALWPEASGRRGHLCDGHQTLRHLDSVDPDGHLEADHLGSEHLWPALSVTFDTPPYVFGRFAHGVTMLDGAGNASSAAIAVVTINSSPTVPECVSRSSYDPATDQVTWSFLASRFEPVPGK